MKKIISIVSTLAMAASFLLPMSAGAVTTTAPGQNKLQCFDGPSDGTVYGGKCTISSHSANNTAATLDNSDSNLNGDYSGVFVKNTTASGQLLSQVSQLGYTYSGNVSPLPGDLSLNVPIDSNNDGVTDFYAFVDAFYCPGTAGTVDVIHDSGCGIFANNVEYANWSAMVLAYPTWKVATDAAPFVIAERTPSELSAIWTVSNVNLSKSGK